MMIFRLSCPQHMRHVVSSAAVNSQSWPIFMVHLKVRDLIEKCLEIPRSEGNEESLHGHIFSGRDASTATAVREVKLGLSLSMTEKSGYCLPDKRPISSSKNLVESTSAATFELGTNLSRKTGDVLVLPSVGTAPRIGMVTPTCFSIPARRRKSPPWVLYPTVSPPSSSPTL